MFFACVCNFTNGSPWFSCVHKWVYSGFTQSLKNRIFNLYKMCTSLLQVTLYFCTFIYLVQYSCNFSRHTWPCCTPLNVFCRTDTSSFTCQSDSWPGHTLNAHSYAPRIKHPHRCTGEKCSRCVSARFLQIKGSEDKAGTSTPTLRSIGSPAGTHPAVHPSVQIH